MRPPSYVIAWCAIVGLVLLVIWGILVDVPTATYLCVPLVLWALLLRVKHGVVWGVLLLLHSFAAVYYVDIYTTFRTLDMLPYALFFGIIPIAMLMDPPLRWPRDRLLQGKATPLFQSPDDRRRDFLQWWTTQHADQRQRVWMRLLPEERRWALEDMPPDVRIIYLHIEHAHSKGHDIRYIG
jgi:hypothetical protein